MRLNELYYRLGVQFPRGEKKDEWVPDPEFPLSKGATHQGKPPIPSFRLRPNPPNHSEMRLITNMVHHVPTCRCTIREVEKTAAKLSVAASINVAPTSSAGKRKAQNAPGVESVEGHDAKQPTQAKGKEKAKGGKDSSKAASASKAKAVPNTKKPRF